MKIVSDLSLMTSQGGVSLRRTLIILQVQVALL